VIGCSPLLVPVQWPGHYADPVNTLDGACVEHDVCYYKCRESNPCRVKDRSSCFIQCDKDLANAAAPMAQRYMRARFGNYIPTLMETAAFDIWNLMRRPEWMPPFRTESNPSECGGCKIPTPPAATRQ
jgi:hypothetical protein